MAVPATEAVPGFPYWLDFDRPAFAALAQDRTADAAVIGAGIAGLKLARCLARQGLEVAVLEGTRVGDGASARNQGTINHGPNLGYRACVERHGRDTARALYHLGLENHRLLREQIEDYAIDCAYEALGQTVLVRRDVDGWEQRLADYRADYELLAADGFEVEWLGESEAQNLGGNPLYAGGLRYGTDAQFHSGKFVISLALGVTRHAQVALYEGTRVRQIERVGPVTRVTTSGGVVTAPLVFLATNALVPQFCPKLERALRAERGQVLVTEPLATRPCRGSFGTALAWWREIRESDGRFRLLFGGGRTRDEPDSLFPQFRPDGGPHPSLESEGFSPSTAHQGRLAVQLATLFPDLAQARITHRWGGLQCFTADDLPVVGLLDPDRNLWGMAGFCGRGNCHSDVGAEFLAGRVVGVVSEVERRFGTLFDSLMRVGRASADWGPWHTVHT
jgi:glycine/D-amino acid oxidase-like deaminating enzyme